MFRLSITPPKTPIFRTPILPLPTPATPARPMMTPMAAMMAAMVRLILILILQLTPQNRTPNRAQKPMIPHPIARKMSRQPARNRTS